jgi:hypothetical protein
MLNELLHKYLYKQPSKDDARSIKRWIDTASEPEIEQALLQEWEKHTVSEPRNWQAYYAVTGQLRSIFNSHKENRSAFFDQSCYQNCGNLAYSIIISDRDLLCDKAISV